MPEGDTIAWTALRLRPVLVGRAPEELIAPRNPSWARRLGGRPVTHIDTHGKHLFVHFDGDLLVHSHLGMTGSWRVSPERRAWSRAWLVIHAAGSWVAELEGPVLELMTEGRRRFDQRLSQLGPDVLAPAFDSERFLVLLRAEDQTRALGDALLDQRNVAGIGNIWKAEGCWEVGLDPWRPLSRVGDAEALAVIEAIRPRMLRSAELGPRSIEPRVYKRAGRPCPRCGARIDARGQGDANRVTYFCSGCQR